MGSPITKNMKEETTEFWRWKNATVDVLLEKNMFRRTRSTDSVFFDGILVSETQKIDSKVGHYKVRLYNEIVFRTTDFLKIEDFLIKKLKLNGQN